MLRRIGFTARRRFVSVTKADGASCVVIGAGVAGSSAALTLADKGVKVLMLASSRDLSDCNSRWAQGGIIYKGKGDSPFLLGKDIHEAGAGICDDRAVMQLGQLGPGAIDRLLLKMCSTEFDRKPDGTYNLCLEAMHSLPRILHTGDYTGKTITDSMQLAVKAHPNITIKHRQAVELAMHQGRCVGVFAMKESNEVVYYPAHETVLATGGLGDLYKNTSNPSSAKGEGLGMAMRAGAAVKSMEYVQFHPTTLYIPGERRFLMTEALRGEGARLLDATGRPFATDYHERGELAPRDVVARMILAEMRAQGAANMYLDISHRDSDWLPGRFPTVFAYCLERGIDIRKDPIPIVPAAHYHCGGVAVDLHGKTNIDGLRACGEVSCTGLHGANRLASTSLLEALVWGQTIGNDMQKNLCTSKIEIPVAQFKAMSTPLDHVESIDVSESWKTLQHIMWDNVGPQRTLDDTHQAFLKISDLYKQAQLVAAARPSRETMSYRNALCAALGIAKAAAQNPMSRGTHYMEATQQAPPVHKLHVMHA